MEKLRAERANLRRLFTTACKQYENLNAKSDTDGKELQILYNKINDKAQRLFTVDSTISSLEEITEVEFDVIEEYRDRFTELKTVHEGILTSNEFNTIPVSTSATTSSPDNIKLPKLNLKEYDLNPRTWVAFWGQFSRIHEDKQLREEDKFQYLLSSLRPKGKARDIAESYPPSKENYQKAIDHLRSRFGRDDLLIEVYIRDLLTLVTSRGNIKLAVLYDRLGSYLRALETLGVTTANYAAMLYPVVESCIPADVLKAWDRHRLNREIDSDSSRGHMKEKLLEEMMSFLRNEVEGEEHRALAESGFDILNKPKRESTSTQRSFEPSAAALASHMPLRALERSTCIFCDRAHSSQDCAKAAMMSHNERKIKVKQKKCCLVCLKPGHFAKHCNSPVRCFICENRHYAFLCPNLPAKEIEKKKSEEKTATLSAAQLSSRVYLKTLLLRVRHRDRTLCVRALLDDGSQRSYVQRDLVQHLKIVPSGREMMSQGLFGGGQTAEAEHGLYNIVVESLDHKFSRTLSLLDQPKICTMLPRVHDKSLLTELATRGIRLTDIGDNDPPIQILIGADILGKILTGRIEVFSSGISAIETKYGWSVLGAKKTKATVRMVALCLQNFTLPSLWELEILGINDPSETKSKTVLNEETLIHFQETVKVNERQRYEVALPWLVGHPPFNDNYEMADKRLRAVTKRLKKEDIYDSYDNIFRNWKNEGIIELVKETDTKVVHYLPHRPVVKLSSATTKIRPVFDASVKRPGSASLNECLSVGPDLSQQIPPLLNRFRFGAIGVTADIKQAFLQISVRPEDRDVLRFLWWEDKERKNLQIYRHCRVVFGVTSSPFLLNATISHHLNSEEFQESVLVQTISKLKEGFYVDNLITSVATENEYLELNNQARNIMTKGLFDLRCWAYTGMQEQEDLNVLGLKWNTQTDELYCLAPKIELKSEENITKRKLLSVINSIYDPIGFASISLWLPKLLLQEAWRNNLDWDDELPAELQQKYRRWAEHIHLIEQCTIPRRMFRGKSDAATLHIFTDASVHAYACCAFLRCEDETEVSVQLVSAKTRIAPIQRPTIPRLELLAAAIGARMAASTLKALQLPLKTYYWTDSMVVLAWITKKEPWNSFIGNRVKEIRELSDTADWRHVPGEINPADLPSRTSNWSDLLRKRWWEGPAWLKGPETDWPNSKLICPDEALQERRKTVLSNVNFQTMEEISHRFEYFSHYPKILRMTGWIIRFCENAKRRNISVSTVLQMKSKTKKYRSK